MTRLREPDSELRLTRIASGSYSAEIATAGSGIGRRVAARHAVELVRHRYLEPVRADGPEWEGIYRLAEHARHKAEPAYREEMLISACALRFDGYLYIEENGIGTRREEDDGTSCLDLSAETERFFTHPDYDAPPDYLRMMLFLVQRKFMRECWLRWESQLARMTRQLFIRTCKGDVPVHLRLEEWADKWDRRFARYADDHIRFIEGRDRATIYDEHLY